MSGSNTTTVNALIKQIQASHQQVVKSFNEHNETVQNVLKQLEKMNQTVSNVERIRVKDPLDELTKLTFEPSVDMMSRLNTLIDILSLYEKDKISTLFKKIFIEHFNAALGRTEVLKSKQQYLYMKTRILNIRDIRWLIQEMEKYPQIFPFDDTDIDLLECVGASRDNIVLVKRILKKDGQYEEHYESGVLESQYSMLNGKLNGPSKVWYENGQLKQETVYENGVQMNKWKVYYENGQLFVDGSVTGENVQWYPSGKLMNKYTRIDNKQEGDYIEYYENGNVWVTATFKNDRVVGDITIYHPNGTIFSKFYSLDGQLKKDQSYCKIRGTLSEWNEDGNLVKEINHDENGLLHGKCWMNNYKTIWNHGIIELTNDDFYLSPEGKNRCNITQNCLVMFYSKEKDLSIFKSLLPFSTCILGLCPNKNNNSDDIIFYYEGKQMLRYSGNYNVKDMMEFLKSFHMHI